MMATRRPVASAIRRSSHYGSGRQPEPKHACHPDWHRRLTIDSLSARARSTHRLRGRQPSGCSDASRSGRHEGLDLNAFVSPSTTCSGTNSARSRSVRITRLNRQPNHPIAQMASPAVMHFLRDHRVLTHLETALDSCNGQRSDRPHDLSHNGFHASARCDDALPACQAESVDSVHPLFHLPRPNSLHRTAHTP